MAYKTSKSLNVEHSKPFVPKESWEQLDAIGLSRDANTMEHVHLYPDVAAEMLHALRSCLDPSAGHWEDIDSPQRGEWLITRRAETPDQSFEDYVASGPNRPHEGRTVLYLLPLCDHEDLTQPAYPLGPWPSFKFLQRAVEQYFFPLPVRVLPAVLVGELRPRPSVREGRGFGEQWDAGDVLNALRCLIPKDAFGLLAATMCDLFKADAKFVEGLARLSSRVAVLSFVRYTRDSHIRSPKWKGTQLLYMALKTTLHEIGHMFGLLHCTWYNCLMRGTHGDGAEHQMNCLHLCPVCLRKLHWNIGFDIPDRYTRLLHIYEAHEREHELFLRDCKFLRERLVILKNLPCNSTAFAGTAPITISSRRAGSSDTAQKEAMCVVPQSMESGYGESPSSFQRRAGRSAASSNTEGPRRAWLRDITT